MVTEVDDIAFLTVRRWQAIAHLVEDAIGDGVFLSHERCGFQPGYDVCFPFGIVRRSMNTGLGL